MKRLFIRVLLLMAVFSLVAVPGAPQYTGCVDCRQADLSDGGHFQFCGDPRSDTWGYENCRMFTIGSIQYCRGDGVRCYYLEVQG